MRQRFNSVFSLQRIGLLNIFKNFTRNRFYLSLLKVVLVTGSLVALSGGEFKKH